MVVRYRTVIYTHEHQKEPPYNIKVLQIQQFCFLSGWHATPADTHYHSSTTRRWHIEMTEIYAALPILEAVSIVRKQNPTDLSN